MTQFGRLLAFAFSLAVAWVLAAGFMTPAPAAAQDSSRTAAKSGNKANAPKRTTKAKRAKAKGKDRSAPVRSVSNEKPADAAAATPAADTESRPGGTAHAPAEDAAALAAEADERVRKEGGEEIKTVEFGGLDIEGQLKTPQMLYFLNRLRAEFSRPELPHRSFIPELQRGTQENGF
jgi:hypothetical protein